jgi:hypothetical protein
MIDNSGTIIASDGRGVYLGNGGEVLNGTPTDIAAAIVSTGYSVLIRGGAGIVTNYGAIGGVALSAGGRVANGSTADTTASIRGGSIGVLLSATGTVTNFGTIEGGSQFGVFLYYGGVLTNGGATETKALIEGRLAGVEVKFAAATVVNFGTIDETGASYDSRGVYLYKGGTLTNGAVTDTAARIDGSIGVFAGSAGATVANFGTIQGAGATGQGGVYLQSGGAVTNGANGDTNALILGNIGVGLSASGTVTNFGTIHGTGAANGRAGVYLQAGGMVTNGAATDQGALIDGYTGLLAAGAAATIANFGTIDGVDVTGQSGIYLHAGGTVTNGGSKDTAAVIEGYIGVEVAGVATVTNFGTISGFGGTAVQFKSSSDVLVVEAGCAFDGAVLGGGGTLDLASGVGRLTGLLSSGGNVTVLGSMATTTFQNFGTVEVGAGAKFTDKGAVTIAAGQTVNDAGTLTLGAIGKNSIVNAGLIETTGGALTLAGTVKNSGTLSVSGGTMTVNGAVTGTGHASVKGGTLDFASTFNEAVTFSGTTGVLELSHSQTYTATITGFSHSGKTSLDLTDIGFVSSSEATFSGTTARGVLTITDGTHTAKINLKGDYTTSTFVASSDGHGGTIVIDPRAGAQLPTATLSGTAHQFIAAMAGLGAGPAGALHTAAQTWRPPVSMLGAPRLNSL